MRDQRHERPLPDTTEPVPRPFGEILAFLHHLDVDPTKVRAEDIDFVYTAMFGVAWSDPEVEELRAEFLRRIGHESARHLCKYMLHHHPVGRFADGFTDTDWAQLTEPLVTAVNMLLHHSEITRDAMCVDLAVSADGELQARVSRDTSGPAPKRRAPRH